MKKIYILFILSLCDPFAFGQQSAMLEKYRSMALEYSHDLKAAEKNLAAKIGRAQRLNSSHWNKSRMPSSA